MYNNNLFRKAFILLSFMTLTALSFALPNNVFQFSYQTQDHELVLQWDIAPGSFLYKDRIQFKNMTKGLVLNDIKWPKTLHHTDKLGVQHAIYENHVILHVPYQSAQLSTMQFNVQYQGCSHQGVCFPPQTATVHFTPTVSMPEHITSKNIILELLSFLGIGVLLAFTPCVLPMLPIMTRIVVGDRSQQSFGQTVGLSIAYVLGMALSYALVGAVIAHIGKNLFILMQQQWIMLSMAGIYIYFGMATLGVVEIKMPDRFQQKTMNLRSSLKSGRYLTATLMGCLSLLVLSPCVTAPLLGALTYITQLDQVWRGSLALFMLGLGMGIPLMIFAISAGHWLPKAGVWMENIKKILAMLLFAISALLITRTTHSHWSLLSWVALIAIAVYLFKPQAMHGKISTTIRSSMMVILVGYGTLLSAGLFKNQYLPWPFASASVHPDYVLHNTGSLKKLLAEKSDTPVLLYFSAKWCATCQHLEKNVWSDKSISPLLNKTTWVKIDLTDNTAQELKLMQQYHVIAPPTVILLNPSAKNDKCRLLGEEITIPHLKKWEKILGKSWSLNTCK